jgi:salicylate hydroxylase
MSNEGIRLTVIGAGLAGLAAALSTKLANPAHTVTVLEAVRELQEVGVSPLSRPAASSHPKSNPPRRQASN